MSSIATLVFLILIEILVPMSANANNTQSLNGAEYRSSILQTPHPISAQGRRSAVVVTSAAEAARGILPLLDDGRMSAADAALSLAFSQIVASGGSWVSLAGILSAMVYDPGSGTIVALDAGYRIPLGETRPSSIPPQSSRSGRGVLTPGFFAGAAALHERFGRTGWLEILSAPIRAAEEGVPVTENLAQLINFRADVLRQSKEAWSIFAPAGRLLQTGDTLKQPQLAALLSDLVINGPRAMQTGPWSDRFARAARAAGGSLSVDDLKLYRATWTDPKNLDLPPYRVFADMQQLGGHCLLDALAQLQHGASDLLPEDSPERWEQIIRISHRCYALALRHGVLADSIKDPIPLAERLTGPKSGAAHSDVVVVAAPDGQVVVLCHSINTTAWGELGLFVDGVAVPDSASFQQRLLRGLAPGDRVPNALSTMIATREGRPYAAAGAIGASVSELMLQVTLEMLVKGRSPAEALLQPHFLRAVWPSIGWFQIVTVGIGIVIVSIGLASAASLTLISWLVLAATCFASVAFSVGVIVGGLSGCYTCISAMDRPHLTFWLGVAALAVVLYSVVVEGLGTPKALLLLATAVCAIVLPLLLRSSLIPVNVILPGTLSADMLTELARRKIVLREIRSDPPFGYFAGVMLNAGRIEAAVSKTSLDGAAYAR